MRQKRPNVRQKRPSVKYGCTGAPPVKKMKKNKKKHKEKRTDTCKTIHTYIDLNIQCRVVQLRARDTHVLGLF
jgi:hypothetical protein